MKIDEEAIRKLAALLDETGLTEIEVEEDDKAIRVSRGGRAVHAPMYMDSDPTTPHPANLKGASTIAAEHPGAITSPMVGTAYMQAEPNAPSFVRKGDSVSEGDTLLIIEAMKVMNPIKAPRSGIVTQLLVENGQPVEFGDVLMVIE
jgi:acetyl-CoA carboxylase biotin carboxyl carrier protein